MEGGRQEVEGARFGGNEGKATQNYAHSASNCATVIILQSPICPIANKSLSPETRYMALVCTANSRR